MNSPHMLRVSRILLEDIIFNQNLNKKSLTDIVKNIEHIKSFVSGLHFALKHVRGFLLPVSRRVSPNLKLIDYRQEVSM